MHSAPDEGDATMIFPHVRSCFCRACYLREGQPSKESREGLGCSSRVPKASDHISNSLSMSKLHEPGRNLSQFTESSPKPCCKRESL